MQSISRQNYWTKKIYCRVAFLKVRYDLSKKWDKKSLTNKNVLLKGGGGTGVSLFEPRHKIRRDSTIKRIKLFTTFFEK